MTSLAIVVGLWVVVGLAALASALRRRANDAKRIERFRRALWLNEERGERGVEPAEALPLSPRPAPRSVTIIGPRHRAGAHTEPTSEASGQARDGDRAPEPEPPLRAPSRRALDRPGRSEDDMPFPRARIPDDTRRHFGGAGRSQPRLAHLGRVAGKEPIELPAAAALEAEARRRAAEHEAPDEPSGPERPSRPEGRSEDVTPDRDREVGKGDQADLETPDDAPPERAAAAALAGAPSWLSDALEEAQGSQPPRRASFGGRAVPRTPFSARHHRPRRLALLGAIATVAIVAVGASVALSETSGSSTLAAPRRHGNGGQSKTRTEQGSATKGSSNAHRSVPTTTTTTAPPKPTLVQPVSSNAQEASYVTPSAPFDLTLTTSGRCWIDLVNRDSGAVLYTGTMTAGESKSFSGLDKVYLRAGRMKNLQISIDGIPVDSPNNGPGVYDFVFQVPSGSTSAQASTLSGSGTASAGTPA
jgi:hypothetical protein